ncbi:hypothetical protein O181_002301 [Austropuccinia psidii MF-1]|uniref:Uncharacterized protein n=1 Tax=Austropuccinia psidii MF-1 TaxID=1389203 RepID=A0A9Q3BBP4_9BASI|nr:hypothetical protein [Austropuccinia psidii MF-1]
MKELLQNSFHPGKELDELGNEFITLIFRTFGQIIRRIPVSITEETFDNNFLEYIGRHFAQLTKQAFSECGGLKSIAAIPISDLVFQSSDFVKNNFSRHHELQELFERLKPGQKQLVFKGFLQEVFENDPTEVLKNDELFKNFFETTPHQEIATEATLMEKMAVHLTHDEISDMDDYKEQELKYLLVYHVLRYELELFPKVVFGEKNTPKLVQYLDFIKTTLRLYMSTQFMMETLAILMKFSPEQVQPHKIQEIANRLMKHGLFPTKLSDVPMLHQRMEENMFIIASLSLQIQKKYTNLMPCIAQIPSLARIYDTAISGRRYVANTHRAHSKSLPARLVQIWWSFHSGSKAE